MSQRTKFPEPGTVSESPEFSPGERRLLLGIAHQSIAAALDGRPLEITPPNLHLAEKRGAFTTLHLEGKLRGCIGYVLSSQPLYRTVAETARSAAFDDPRFQPVAPEEAAALKVEISVLSPLRQIAPEDVVVGKHGLVVTQGSPTRAAPAAGPAGVGLGPRDISVANLYKSRACSRCVATRGGFTSLHRRGLWRGVIPTSGPL
jgi:AmmeMemoRadiSam system protein A